MRIIGASFLILCNAEFDILQDGGIVIDNGTIVEVGCFEDLRTEGLFCCFDIVISFLADGFVVNGLISSSFSLVESISFFIGALVVVGLLVLAQSYL